MESFKLFVSSPGDAMVERRRVENVVSRLNGEFADVAGLEAIRWETGFYQAFSTFQAQIPRSTDCDLVIGILRWRLGTELPPAFGEKLSDGRPFPSGTAYEILTAIEKRQKGGKLPDIYVFRFAGSSPTVAIDDPNRARVERDWQVLKGFFQEWFLTERGYFKTAFNPYSSADDFEAQLEKLLRKWVADKVAGGRVVRWPIDVKGSPFCGLAAFGAKHAPVFFGRSDDTARALDLWREAASRGSPYLLVVGGSGSGKSSLARAALMPRLTTPGVIQEVDVWRIAVMRPGDGPAGPFAALAAALMRDEASLPKEEEGRGPALPEIGQGDSKTPTELAAVMRNKDATAAIRPIVNALSRVGTEEHDRERYSREVRCDLVLLIDQFEELFSTSVSEVERARFIDLVAALVGRGRIWVIATLRADFYAQVLEQPVLKKLKELGATNDLAPPGPVELAETVRAPAEAAGLIFETDATTGERLDARLLRDADQPDMLPLVQLALSRLFEGRERIGSEARLPLKVYESLGGLKGIVNEAGETALALCSEVEKARLPRLLRELAVSAHEQDGVGKGALTIRAATLAQAAPDQIARKLVDALVTARLLTTSGTEADAQVRLTHQRVLQDWARARTIVAESADFYRIRDDLEERSRKWETAKRRKELLLARGLPLAEAENIVGKYGDELTPKVRAYVKSSRWRANRTLMIGWAAAVLFAVVAIVAVIGIIQAYQAVTATMKMANSLVFDMGQDPRMRDLPADLRSQIFDRAIQGYDEVIRINPNYVLSYNGRGAAYAAKNDFDHAIADYSRAIALDPKFAIASYNRGNAYRAKKDLDHAIADYSQTIALDPKYTKAYSNRGLAYYDKRDFDLAIADFDHAITLDPKNVSYYTDRGNTYFNMGRFDPAIADYSRVITLDSKNAVAYYDRGNAYRTKGELDYAIADLDRAIKLDPKAASYYDSRGVAYVDKGHFDLAIADFDQAITLDPKDVSHYIGRGDAYSDKGDFDHAIADYSQAIALDPKSSYAYFQRALAYFCVGTLPKALADLDRSSKLDPTYPYAAIWLDIVDKRSNLPTRLSEATAQIDMIKWPAPVIRLYLGQLSPQDVLASADDVDPKTKRNQVCDANFYIGEFWLGQNKREEAARLFRLAAADCPKNLDERRTAHAELKAGQGP
jgi:tetratricopeptide (TPR) repeat protein